MKTKNLLYSLLLISVGTTSCNLNSDPTDNYQTFQYQVCNLVIPSSGSSFATGADYALTYYIYESTMSLQCGNLNLGYGNESFVTSPMKYTINGYTDNNNNYYEVTKFSGGVANSSNLTINNITGYTSTIVNTLLNGDPVISRYPTVMKPALILQYDVNQTYKVKTFMRDQIYTGTTTIRTESTGDSFSNDDIRYRLYFKEDLKKADIVFYSAKFAQAMPVTITFVLENLDVVYNRAGYTVRIPEGETIIPKMFEGGELTEYPAYIFTNFLLNSATDNLTNAMVNYTVEGFGNKYYGTFAGAYVRAGGASEE